MDVKQRHILIIRISALGDIAIAAPLIKEYACKNPGIRFTVVSQKMVEPLFDGVENLHFEPISFKPGKMDALTVAGFARSLLRLRPTEVADIHDVPRSRIIRYYLWLHGIPYRKICKNRKRKKELTRRRNKVLVPLKTSQRSYEEVLVALGLEDLQFACRPAEPLRKVQSPFRRIGIAPFAKHPGKQWPLEYMEEVVARLGEDPDNKIVLFGGGKEQTEILRNWESKYPHTESAAGKYTLKEELEFIKGLNVMISMDSANMHFASVVRTPVISIWGNTHPYGGFYGWGQDPANIIQLDLPCRPCSVFGNRKCFRSDRPYECMRDITPRQVLDKITEVIHG